MTETWRDYEHKVRQQPYNKEIAIPKNVEIPPHFIQSRLSHNKGAHTAYRENRAVDSIHIREYPDKYTIEVDQFNPHHHPVKHAVFDAGKEFAGIAAGLLGLGVTAWKARRLLT